MTRPTLADILLGFFVALGLVSLLVQLLVLFGAIE